MPTPRVQNLERRRLAAQVTIEDLAREARGSSVTYWRWVRDDNAPSPFVLGTFETALNTLIARKIVTLQQLLQEPPHGAKSHDNPPSRKEEPAKGGKGVKAKVRPQGQRRSPAAVDRGRAKGHEPDPGAGGPAS